MKTHAIHKQFIFVFMVLFEAFVATNADSQQRAPTSEAMSLRLLLNPGNGETQFGQTSGLHGRIYMAAGDRFKTPALPETARVDILKGGENIVVMVLDNGPIFSSTNSGTSWNVYTAPGKYEFPLTVGPKGGGFIASGTIRPSPFNQSPTNLISKWYAIGSSPNGTKLIVSGDVSQSAPALTIRQSNGSVVISWPAKFTGFILQENQDITSTNWADVTAPVNVVEEKNQVVLSSAMDNNFYRLRSQ